MKKIIFFLTLAYSTSSFAQTSLDCLVAHWPFSGSGTDVSGKENDATLHGPTLTQDRFGNDNSAYYFDGIDDYMEVSSSSNLEFEGDGTLSLWVKQSGDVGSLLWKRSYSGSIGWTAYFGLSNTVISYVNNDATHTEGTTTSDAWQHIVVVSEAGTMKLYINAVLVDTKNNSAGFQKNTTPLLIGNDENNNYFNGSLDDIRIYNCALPDSEILSLYHEPSSCSAIVYWPFDNNADDIIASNNANVHGATLVSDRFGNANSAYSFDGIDDYLEVSDSPVLNFGGAGTISLWVKQNGDPGCLLWKRFYIGSTGWTMYFAQPNLLVNYVNSNAVYTKGNATSDVWQHIVLVSDGNYSRLYIDGELTDSKNTSGFQESSASLLIGKDENNNYFKGMIDDVHIYNCALSNTQVSSLYNQEQASVATSREESSDTYFKVFPNPAKDKVTIVNTASFKGDMEVTVLNSSGLQIGSYHFSNQDVMDVDVSNYIQGIYFFVIKMDQTVWSKKIIVQ